MAPATPIQEEEDDDVPSMSSDLDADILQTILTYLPYPDLVAASFLSNEWLRHVHFSLRAHPRLHSWLLLHHLPHQHAQTYLVPPPLLHSPIDATQLLASHPAMLYQLSPSSLSVSLDPLASASESRMFVLEKSSGEFSALDLAAGLCHRPHASD